MQDAAETTGSTLSPFVPTSWTRTGCAVARLLSLVCIVSAIYLRNSRYPDRTSVMKLSALCLLLHEQARARSDRARAKGCDRVRLITQSKVLASIRQFPDCPNSPLRLTVLNLCLCDTSKGLLDPPDKVIFDHGEIELIYQITPLGFLNAALQLLEQAAGINAHMTTAQQFA